MTTRTATLDFRAIADSSVLVIFLYVLMATIYAFVQPSALSQYSIESLFNNSLPLMLAAAGATFVILQGGFDLSVAGVISVANVVVAVLELEGATGAAISLGAVMCIGLLVGAINGFFVAYLKIQSIAATLATMIICKGIALLILKAPGGYVSDFMAYDLTASFFGLIPITAVIAIVVIVLWSVFRSTNSGRALFAVGEDEHAASLSGVNVARTRFLAFCIAGVFYALAGYMLAAQTSTGSPNAGDPFLLLCFAAVALGGTSFAGGQGGVTASLFGAATLMLMQKMLFAVGVSSFYTGVVQGVIMILAVMFTSFVQRATRRKNA